MEPLQEQSTDSETEVAQLNNDTTGGSATVPSSSAEDGNIGKLDTSCDVVGLGITLGDDILRAAIEARSRRKNSNSSLLKPTTLRHRSRSETAPPVRPPMMRRVTSLPEMQDTAPVEVTTSAVVEEAGRLPPSPSLTPADAVKTGSDHPNIAHTYESANNSSAIDYSQDVIYADLPVSVPHWLSEKPSWYHETQIRIGTETMIETTIPVVAEPACHEEKSHADAKKPSLAPEMDWWAPWTLGSKQEDLVSSLSNTLDRAIVRPDSSEGRVLSPGDVQRFSNAPMLASATSASSLRSANINMIGADPTTLDRWSLQLQHRSTLR